MGRSQREQRLRIAQRCIAVVGAVTLLSSFLPDAFIFGTWPLPTMGQRDGASVGRLRNRPATQLFAQADSSTASQDLKARLLDLLDDATVAEEVLRLEGKPLRGRIDEMITSLERLNPCIEPVYSELIDGTWKVKYAGSYAPGLLSSPTRELALFLYGGGFSLGSALSSFTQGFWGQSLGVTLGPRTVQIKNGQTASAEAEVEFAGRKDMLKYTAELMPLSGQRMSEEVMSFELPPPLGKQQELPVELRRSILITYLDDEFLIVRDESGVPEVLVRQGMAASSPDAPAQTLTEEQVEQALSQAGEDPMSSEAA